MTLQVRVQDAVFQEDLDILGRMDPYLVLTIGTYRQRTKTCQAGGRTPQWNQTFLFRLEPMDSTLKLEAWDEDVIKDDFVGEATISLNKFKGNQQGVKQYVQVKKNGKNSGRIMLNIRYIAEKGPQNTPPAINPMNVQTQGVNTSGGTPSGTGNQFPQYGATENQFPVPGPQNTVYNQSGQVYQQNNPSQAWGSNNYNRPQGLGGFAVQAVQGMLNPGFYAPSGGNQSNPLHMDVRTANIFQGLLGNGHPYNNPAPSNNSFPSNNGWGPMPPPPGPNQWGNGW